MKIKIGYFEVDVKAKYETSQKMSEEDTKIFLATIANALSDASYWNKTQGYEYTALTQKDMFSDICNKIL